MQDTIIKQNGRSRIVRAPADMPDTFTAWRAQCLAGNAYLDIEVNTSTEEQTAGLETVGTPLSKATILPDTLAGRVCAGVENPTAADAITGLADGEQVFVATLLAEGWTDEGDGKYTQTVDCPGLLEAYDVEAPQVTSTGQQEQDAALKDGLDALCEAGNSGETLDGQLQWTCYNGHPEIDLPLRLRRVKYMEV